MLAAYTRLSNEKKDSESIENQLSIISEFISKNEDLALLEKIEYTDFGHSGLTLDRPAVQKLLTDIRLRKIKVLIVKDFSRLSRNYLDSCTLIDSIFPFMGVRVISIADNYDSVKNTPSALNLASAFKAILDEFHSTETSEKIKRVFEQKLRNGMCVRQLPYGYFLSEKEIKIDEKQAEIIRRIFNLRIDGKSCPQIAGVLNSNGILTKKGNQWSGATVNNLLKNTDYIGVRVSRKYIKDVKTKKNTRSDENYRIINKNAFPPIISSDIFEKAHATFTVKPRPNSAVGQITANKLYCATCKRALKINIRSFSCPNRDITGQDRCFSDSISKETLYNAVLEKVKIKLTEELSKYDGYFSFSVLQKVQKEIDKLKEKLTVIFERYSRQELSKQEFINQKNIISKRITELENKIKISQQQQFLTEKGIDGIRPIDLLRKLIKATELTKEHIMFVDKVWIYNIDCFEILLYKNSPLEIMSQNMSIYEEI